MQTDKNLVSGNETVKTSILGLNRLTVIKQEIDSLKNEQKSTLAHLFSSLSDLTKLEIKGLENLTASQKRILILNEIEINLEDDYAIKILSVIKWYYNSGLSIKKEFITYANIKALKKLHKCYLKADINRVFKDKAIVTSADYNKAINSILDKATLLNTLLLNVKNKDINVALDSKVTGVLMNGSKVDYDLKTVDYVAVQSFNNECYIATLQKAIKEA